jgi:hypothetical protein
MDTTAAGVFNNWTFDNVTGPWKVMNGTDFPRILLGALSHCGAPVLWRSIGPSALFGLKRAGPEHVVRHGERTRIYLLVVNAVAN